MKITKLSAKNFWSYQEIDFKFDKGLCLVEGFNYDEGGSNGAGKSGLMNAVCFALFGDIPKKIKLDDVINQDSSKDCLVTLELEEGSNYKFKIERGRKPNVFNFYINGEKKSDVDNTKTQKMLEECLGISFDTFINSVYFSQNSLNFLSLNDENKKTILTDVLNLHIFDKAHDKVKAEISKISSALEKVKAEVSSRNTSIANLNKDIDDLKIRNRHYKKDKEDKIAAFDQQLLQIEDQIASGTDGLNSLKELVTSSQNAVVLFLTGKHEKEDAILLLQKELQAEVDKLNKYKATINVIDEESKKYNLNAEKCPKCFQDVDHSLLDSLKAEKTQKRNDLLGVINECQEKISQLPSSSDLNTALRKISIEESNLKMAQQKNESELKNIQNNIKNWNDRKSEIEKIRQSVAVEDNPYEKMLSELSDRLVSLNSESVDSDDLLEKATNKLNSLTELKEVFGNKGIKSYIFDTVINQLNYKINTYLKDLFRRDVHFSFLTEVQNSKGLMKQTISNQLMIDNTEVPLARLSGGEERRLSFAITLAISDIISSRYMKSFNILFLDEVFDGLDAENKDKCMNLLTKIKKDCIMVIDHASEFQALFDNVVKIVKKDGISKIE